MVEWARARQCMATTRGCIRHCRTVSGFPRLLEWPGVVFVKFPGHGKSWNLLGNDADAVLRTQTPKYARPHTSILCSNSFFAISSQHVTVMNIYSSMDAAAVCLYIETLPAYDRVLEKCFWVLEKSWNFL